MQSMFSGGLVELAFRVAGRGVRRLLLVGFVKGQRVMFACLQTGQDLRLWPAH